MRYIKTYEKVKVDANLILLVNSFCRKTRKFFIQNDIDITYNQVWAMDIGYVYEFRYEEKIENCPVFDLIKNNEQEYTLEVNEFRIRHNGLSRAAADKCLKLLFMIKEILERYKPSTQSKEKKAHYDWEMIDLHINVSDIPNINKDLDILIDENKYNL